MTPHREKKNRPAPGRSSPGAKPPPGSADAGGAASRPRLPAAFPGVILCFGLSGFAALLYQTAWLREFSIVFGTSDLAVATVLAAYMAGLALGAALAGRWAGRVTRPVLVYGVLEGGIAAAALAVPALLAGAGALYVAVLGGQPDPPSATGFGQPLFYLLVGFAVLALPTAMMGATLPLLTRYAVRTDSEVGPRVALLYAVNTAGAVGGTLCAAFLLLPALGLNGTILIGAGVNVVIFGVAVTLARRAGAEVADDDATRQAPPAGFFASCIRPLLQRGSFRQRLVGAAREQPAWMRPLMLVSGANAFLYEVLWTRMLSHVLGGSVYAFAAMLAAFLAGITLGSAAARWAAVTRERAAAAFVVVQIGIAALSAGVYAWMQALVPAGRDTLELAGYAVGIMLPAAIFIGATFPLAVRVVARTERDVAPATAAVYAWNTVGGIAGAVAAGFMLIPALGFEGAIRLAVLVNLTLALVAAVVVAPVSAARIAAPVALLVLALAVYSPTRPTAVIERTVFATESVADGRELYYGVGRSATVLVRTGDGAMRIFANGLPEASVLPSGAPLIEQPHQWLTALAVAARPDAESMLMVGLGGGVSLENLPGVDAVDVVELEPEIVAANRRLGELRAVDPLADPRVSIIVNDARNALRLTGKHYDLIVSQPSHPWTAAASHLFTREFMTLAKRRLSAEGVFVQWISANFVDEPLLRSLAATVSGVFENVRVYQTGSALFFLASDGGLEIERRLARTGRPLNQHLLHYSYLGLGSVDDFVSALALDERGVEALAHGARPTTDDHNRMATDSRTLADGLDTQALTRVFEPHDPLLDPDGWIHTELGEQLSYPYIASRLLRDGRGERATALGATVTDPATRALITALSESARERREAAERAVLEALRADPDNDEARYALIEPRLVALATGNVSQRIIELASALPTSAAAVVEGWRYAVQQDWQALANLDAKLARARATDLWFPAAQQLRAEWRVRAAGETRYARDALRLVDRALVLRPSFELLMLRVAAADALGDMDALTESARAVARRVRQRAEPGAASTGLVEAERVRMAGGLEALRERLTPLDSPASRTALDAINAALQALEDADR